MELKNIKKIKAVIYSRKKIESISLDLNEIVSFKERLRNEILQTPIPEGSTGFETVCKNCYKITACSKGVDNLKESFKSIRYSSYAGNPEYRGKKDKEGLQAHFKEMLKTNNFEKIKQIANRSKEIKEELEKDFKTLLLKAVNKDDFEDLAKSGISVVLSEKTIWTEEAGLKLLDKIGVKEMPKTKDLTEEQKEKYKEFLVNLSGFRIHSSGKSVNEEIEHLKTIQQKYLFANKMRSDDK